MTFRPIVFLGFVGLLLLAVYTTPALIDDSQETQSTVITIQNDTEEQIYNNLNATVLEVNAGVNATVEVENTDTQSTASATINETNSTTFVVDNEDITMTVRDVSLSDAELKFDYSPTIFYPSGMSFLITNLGMLTLAFVVIVLFGLAWTSI